MTWNHQTTTTTTHNQHHRPSFDSTNSPSSSMSSSLTEHQFPKEIDERGNIEYKYRLVDIPEERIFHLRTQMKWRVEEGKGEALYRIGVKDNGEATGLNPIELKISLDTLMYKIAQPLGFHCEEMCREDGKQLDCHIALMKITSPKVKSSQAEVRVALVGGHGVGKSTLAALLVNVALLDDGRGKARRRVALHKHELTLGTTSSFSLHRLNDCTRVESVFHARAGPGSETSQLKSTIVLMDTPGKHLSTALRGLATCAPDYVLVCKNDLESSQVFLDIAKQMKIPVFVVNTKSDLCTTSVEGDFSVSCVTGSGIDALRNFLFQLEKPIRTTTATTTTTTVLSVQHCFSFFGDEDDEEEETSTTDNVVVLTGLMEIGQLRVKDRVFVGPVDAATGEFVCGTVLSLQGWTKSLVTANQSTTCGVGVQFDRPFTSQQQQGGALVLSSSPFPVQESISVHFPDLVTWKPNEEVMIFTGTVYQAARVMMPHAEASFMVSFRFVHRMECVLPDKLVFVKRGGSVVVGTVV